MGIKYVYVIGFLLSIPLFSFAQLFNGVTQTSIALTPAFPEAGQEVKASFRPGGYDTSNATIRWFIDGTELTENQNQRSIRFTTGASGEKNTISVQATLPSGQTINASTEVVPTRLDLIVEGTGYVPYFYKGRSLPSSRSIVRVVAITDKDISPNNLTYKWYKNSKVLFGGPVKGKNVAVFESPTSGIVKMGVIVSDSQGRTLVQKFESFRIATPDVFFYKLNPLKGIARNALPITPIAFTDPEMTIRAEPYYIDSVDANQEMTQTWEINGDEIDNPNEDVRNITLRKGEGIGSFNVEYVIRNIKKSLQYASNEFVLEF